MIVEELAWVESHTCFEELIIVVVKQSISLFIKQVVEHQTSLKQDLIIIKGHLRVLIIMDYFESFVISVDSFVASFLAIQDC